MAELSGKAAAVKYERGFAVPRQFALQFLKLAVGEACTNAVKYGCPGNGTHNVEIRCEVLSVGLLVEVRNSVDHCESPVVPNEPDLDNEGGLGLFLMRSLMDEVDVICERQIATVKMLKKLPAVP